MLSWKISAAGILTHQIVSASQRLPATSAQLPLFPLNPSLSSKEWHLQNG